MALTFGNATSDRVDCGSGASLDNLTNRTYLLWVYPTTLVDAGGFLGKQTNTAVNNRLCLSGTAGELRLFIATTPTPNLSVTTSNAVLTINKWWCVAATTAAATLTGKIYRGDRATALTECTYSATQAGTTAFEADDTKSLLLGNNGSLIVALAGRIAFVAVWNRELALVELVTQQFRPRVTSGCVLFMHLGWNGTGTQPDWSGNGNAGTVTGATLTPDHAPLGPLGLGRIPRLFAPAVVSRLLPELLHHGA